MGDSMATVAKQYPDTKFAIIDVNAAGLKGKPTNVRGIVFAEQEAGCLVGVAAATESKTGTISSVGGLKIPPVDAYIAGYQYCAKQVKPDIKTLNGYSQDFVAQDKCQELALNQIGQGSDVVFQVAGQCGLGAITAAGDKGVWGIGVDNDQAFLGPQVLTSAQKKVNVGVSDTIGLVVDNTFKGGVDGLFNTANDGVGYGKVSEASDESRRVDRHARRVDEEADRRRRQAAAHRRQRSRATSSERLDLLEGVDRCRVEPDAATAMRHGDTAAANR